MNRPAETSLVSPWDNYNQELVSQLHPSDWANPSPAPRYNLVVIGAGTAGVLPPPRAARLLGKERPHPRPLPGGACPYVGWGSSTSLHPSCPPPLDVRACDAF